VIESLNFTILILTELQTVIGELQNDRVNTQGIAKIRCGPLQLFVVSAQILSMISIPPLQRFVVTYIRSVGST